MSNGSGVRVRHRSVLGAVAVATVVLAAIGLGLSGLELREQRTPVIDLMPGDCFAYPGDGVVPAAVETVPCSGIHFAEVLGTVPERDTDACVHLFEAYTGAENYWATGYILGFLDAAGDTLCFAYGPEDFSGSLRS